MFSPSPDAVAHVANRLSITIRRAGEQDQARIRAMVHKARINPSGLAWPNFVAAEDERGIVGVAQVRKHRDGSRELASLVVNEGLRGQGIAARMIDALLETEPGHMFMITTQDHAAHYERWGFDVIERSAASPPVRRNQRMGSLARLVLILLGRPMRPLVVLERTACSAAGRNSRGLV